ncbi:MAG TPA: hypothetical protein ENK06_13180 [Gammaproteobacteria bacterium]|nr:hypothetical protein [Gammaproteobacteria bacterium]
MKSLTRQGFLTEEEGMLGLNETDDIDPSLVPLHSASCTYRIAQALENNTCPGRVYSNGYSILTSNNVLIAMAR